MIVYRSQQRTVPTGEAIANLRACFDAVQKRSRPPHQSVQQLLIEFGEFESGAADALGAAASPELRTLRRAAAHLGRMFVRSWREEPMQGWVERFGAAFAEVEGLRLPSTIRTSVAEGYAYYALYPETYIAAAGKFMTARKPGRAVVVGIRSIGTSLSAVVDGALQEAEWTTRSFTVRPEGHPFDRRLIADTELEAEWRARADWDFLIVDEGPGMSGSSFAAVARALQRAGIPSRHIFLFPSWDASGDSFVNAEAAAQWRKHPRFTAALDEVWMQDGRLKRPLSSTTLRDVSAGKWRDAFLPNVMTWPAVQPQHESRKFLAGGAMLKFAGLGRYGEQKVEVARQLSDEALTPPFAGLNSGFLVSSVVDGAPVRVDADLVDTIARYLAFRRGAFPRARSCDFEELRRMITVNCEEGIGSAPADAWFARARAEFDSRPACAIDGRMLAHEWLSTVAGPVKTDAVDHHADHFYPGCADIAWDLAAAAVEFDFDRSQRERLLERYAARSGDRPSDALIAFYEVAWLAFRLGYVSMAAQAGIDIAEQRRFERDRVRYRRLLQAAVGVEAEDWRVPA